MAEDPVVEVDDDAFEEMIKEGVTLVDCFAPWCGPCQTLVPVLQKVAVELKAIMKFAKINIDASHIAQTYKVVSVPTLILFKQGKEIKRLVGLKDYSAIKIFALSWKEESNG